MGTLIDSSVLMAAERGIGVHDAMIAATALAMGYRVATRDVRSFPKVSGLRVARW